MQNVGRIYSFKQSAQFNVPRSSGVGFSCSLFPPCPSPAAVEPYDGCDRAKPKQCLAKKQNGHEMSTYGGFWVRLELFYLLGKKKIRKQKVKVAMV